MDKFIILISSFGQLISRDPFTYRTPDLGVYRQDRLLDEHYISALPELLVEVLSPANRKGNLAELIEDYEHLGAPEIWFVQREQHRIQRRLLDGSRLVERGIFTAGSLAPQSAPDAAVDLDQLWSGFFIRP